MIRALAQEADWSGWHTRCRVVAQAARQARSGHSPVAGLVLRPCDTGALP